MTSGRITKNTFYLTLAYVIQKVIAFVYFALLARFLGAGDVGKYVFALSFTTIFSVFVDVGLNSVLTREVAKQKDKSNVFLKNVFTFKLIASVLIYGAIVLVINLLGYQTITKQLVYLAGLVMILDSFTLSFYAIFRGHQNLKYEGIGTIIYQIIVMTGGGIAIFLKLPLHVFISVLILASLFNFSFSLILLYKKLNIQLGWQIDKPILKFLLTITIPFAIAGIFIKVYSYMDQVLLSKLAGDTALGFYSVGYKLTFALQFIPAAFGASIFPALAEFYVQAREKLSQTFEKAISYLSVLAFPISVGGFILADKIILEIYGPEYQASILVLQILICAMFFIFINYPLGSILNACDRQKNNTINIGITMVVNIILNLILIPRYTYLGASIAALISHGLLTGLGLYWVGKTIDYNRWHVWKIILKSILASLIMGGVIYCFKSWLWWPFWIPVGGGIYILIIILIGGLKRQDVQSILLSFKK
ncbi:MAG: flippase [Patescibacteria group bacterium]|nr:flippase [Patescibacteria group bacterium]